MSDNDNFANVAMGAAIASMVLSVLVRFVIAHQRMQDEQQQQQEGGYDALQNGPGPNAV